MEIRTVPDHFITKETIQFTDLLSFDPKGIDGGIITLLIQFYTKGEVHFSVSETDEGSAMLRKTLL